MTKTIAIHQPNYLPYLGFFDKIKKSDIFVIFDNAQFSKGDFHNRNRIKNGQGAKWLTIPVEKSMIPLNELRVGGEVVGTKYHWCDYHCGLIANAYAKAPFFKEVSEEVKTLYREAKAMRESDSLAGNNILFINFLLKKFRINTPVLLASGMDIHTARNQRIIDICKKLNGDVYLSGDGADYLDERLFNDSGIKVVYQNFKHPIYPQANGDFIPFMSSLDYLFNCGTNLPNSESKTDSPGD